MSVDAAKVRPNTAMNSSTLATDCRLNAVDLILGALYIVTTFLGVRGLASNTKQQLNGKA